MAVKAYVFPLLVVLLLAACSQASPGAGTTTAAPVTTSAKPTLAGATLLLTCPEVESVIITLNGVPTAGQYGAAHTEMQALSDAGDLETRNALTGVVASLGKLQSAQQGSENLDGQRALLAALDDLAGRCKTVGSSALQ